MKILTESTAWKLVDCGLKSGLFFQTPDGHNLARIGGPQPTVYFYERHHKRYVAIDIDTLRALWELHY